ncbi:MAG: HAD family hydrolase [Roseburia sp.]|nr:HAD family hydrolase [Roseburia sp.]
MYKAAIFDLDGTLLDTSRTIHSVLLKSLKTFSLPEISLNDTVRFVGNGARKLVERAVGENSPELIERVYKDYSERFATCSNELSTLYEGEAETLENLKKNGILLAIVTNKPQRAGIVVYNEFFAKFGFREVLCQTETVPLKPNPTSTCQIIQKYGLNKNECIFVGDGETDVQTAANAGIDCVSVLWGFRSYEQLKSSGAKKFVADYKELEKVILG